MSPKITLIVGSPRKNKSCNFLIDKAIEGIESTSDDLEINKLFIDNFEILPCTGCDQCLRKPYECPLSSDDDTSQLKEELVNSDAILIASPNYFGSVSSQIKLLIDRSRPWKMDNYLLQDTYFAPLVSQGVRNGGAGNVANDLINFALIQGMIVVAALGNPVIEQNIPVTSLQKYERKSFIGKEETDELGGRIASNLGKRIAELVLKNKK
ncbi:MAG: NADPH-dependent FMN reductase [Promethearchaeota archaeon]|nr:MAG: NADPH-dependent FMN reductase [Candidatus Lokiarchaeota archaeon]